LKFVHTDNSDNSPTPASTFYVGQNVTGVTNVGVTRFGNWWLFYTLFYITKWLPIFSHRSSSSKAL